MYPPPPQDPSSGWAPQGPQQPYPYGYGQPPQPQPPPPKKTSTALTAIGLICGCCLLCGVFGLVAEIVSPTPRAAPAPGARTAQTAEPAPGAELRPETAGAAGSPAAQAPTPTPPAAPPAPSVAPADPRPFITDTCARVAHLFGTQSRLTELQQEELWRRYDQRWVRWRVQVGEVSNGALGGLQMQFKCSGEALIADGSAFFPDDARARLLRVRPDEIVTLVAKLNDHGQLLGLSLDEASLE